MNPWGANSLDAGTDDALDTRAHDAFDAGADNALDTGAHDAAVVNGHTIDGINGQRGAGDRTRIRLNTADNDPGEHGARSR